jgi:hypothetical protein
VPAGWCESHLPAYPRDKRGGDSAPPSTPTTRRGSSASSTDCRPRSTTCWPAPAPICPQISCVTPSAVGWCSHSRSRPALKRGVRPAGELLGLSPPAAPREIVLLDAVLVNAYNTYFVDHTRSERSRYRLSWSAIRQVANPPPTGTNRLSASAEGSRRPVGCQVTYVVRFRRLCRAVEMGVRPTAASTSAWAAWRASANTVLSLHEAASAFAPS